MMRKRINGGVKRRRIRQSNGPTPNGNGGSGYTIKDAVDRVTAPANLQRQAMGRPLGVPNRIPTFIKGAIVTALEQVGEDGKGKDGAIGYMRRLAMYEPAVFAGLIKRILPVKISADLDPEGLTARLMQTISAQRTLLTSGSANGLGNGRVIDVVPDKS